MLNDQERRPGRPSLEPGTRSTTIPVRFGPSAHERLIREASQRRMKVTEYIRRKATDDWDEEEG